MNIFKGNIMPSPKRYTRSLSGGKRQRCGKCKGCTRPLCGKCDPCKDKKIFGGLNKMKKGCVRRDCVYYPQGTLHSELQKEVVTSSPLVAKSKEPKENNKMQPSKTFTYINTGVKMNAAGNVIKKLDMDSCKTLQRKNETKEDGDKPSSPSKYRDPFPHVNLYKMSKNDLSTFMLKMLKTLALKGSISLREKPDWWPTCVEWGVTPYLEREEMINVIRQCYKANGKENMIGPSLPMIYSQPIVRFPISATACKMVSLNKSQSDVLPPSPVKSRGFPKELFLPFSVEIYLCYFCEKEFTSKDKMRIHQKRCDERPPELIHSSFIKKVPDQIAGISPPQISPKSSNLRLDTDTSVKHLPLKTFVGYLDLVPSQAVSKMRAKRKCSEISQDILEEIEPMSPPVTTPRTPKSLMSQWSREDAGVIAKKRLSYSLSMDKGEEKEDVTKEKEDSSDSEEELEADRPKSTNLLNIPLSSLLGQKIQKYVQLDMVTPILSNSELFCKTPTKNDFLEKLRKKPPSYPVMYKPRRIASLDKQNHLYKFNKQQTREFLVKLKTGLNLASQEKLRFVKKLRVKLPRLSEKEILKWMSPVQMERQLYRKFRKRKPYRAATKPDEFPAGPTLLSKNIDKLLGLKRRSSIDNPSLLLSIYVSEEIEAEISKLQLALYKCLLYEMSVLKPAVVITNVKPNPEQGPVRHRDNSLPSKDKALQENSVKPFSGDNGNKSIPKHYSVLRSMLQEQKAEKNRADLRGKRNVTNPQKHLSLFSVPKKVDPSGDSLKNTERCRSIESPKEVKGLCSPGDRSHCDDPLSVISLSSDMESFSSECCLNCKTNEQKSQIKVGRQLDNNYLGEPCMMEPLTVSVDEADLLLHSSQSLNIIGGIPSPISTASESPPPLNQQLTPDISSQMDDGVYHVGTSNEQRRSTRSSNFLKKASRRNIKQSEGGSSSLHNPDVVPNRVKSLRQSSRSKSLTPSNSPEKFNLKMSVSLPCTPVKSNSLNQVFENTDSSDRVLRNSYSKRKTPQLSPGSMAQNPYSLKSGNFVVSTPIKMSPQKSFHSPSVLKTNLQFRGSPTLSPSTRSAKRKRTSDFVKEPKSKKMKFL